MKLTEKQKFGFISLLCYENRQGDKEHVIIPIRHRGALLDGYLTAF